NDDLLGGDITDTLSLAGDNGDNILDPSETWIFTAPDYTITQADVDAGNITNNVTANGLQPDGTSTVQATDTYVIDANNPDVTLCDDGGIEVVKAASSPTAGCVGEGDLVTYTFTVTNTGDVSINSITINDDLLGGDITATLSLAGDNGDNILDPSETWIFTAPDYTITQADVDAGNITNNVTASGLQPDGTTTVQANDSYVIDANNPDVTLCSDSGIALIKTGVFNNDNGNDCTEIDETITYTFTVTNNGDIALGNVIITDPLLDNATPIVSINFVSGDTDGDNQLDPTETWVFSATYLVTQTDIDATEVTNTATVTATEVVNGTSVTATSQTTTELIEDTTPPDVSNCNVVDETIECSGTDNETIANNWNATNILDLENCATDACDNNITITSNYNFGNLVSNCGAGGTITVIYTLTDATGNASTLAATLTLEDTIGPDLSACAVADETIECNGNDNETLAAAWNTANIAALETCGTDTCDLIPTNLVTSDYDFTNLVPSCGAGGIITVIYTVADDCGNTSTLSATLTIEDTTPPTFSVPTDITIECDVDITDLSLTGDVTDESDDCSSIALNATFTDSVVEGSCPNESMITRTWSLTDECSNTTTFVQTITVQDTTAPTFNETLPADTNAECDNVPTAETLTASDNCGTANVSFTEEITNGACVGDYIIVRTWTATDSCNNETVHTQIITVEDNTAPTSVTPYDENITVACDGIPTRPDLVFEDSCSNDISVAYDEVSTQENDFEDYQIIRTWTVIDDCGNEAAFTQTINVEISNVINVMDAERCVLDIEFDLFDLLSGDFDMNGTWSVVTGNTTLNGSFFDPSTADVGVYTFMYSITEGPCPREVEVNVTMDDECLVLPCSSEDNVLISKTVTANGDTVNDVFTVELIEQCGFVVELQIFNRWGAEIYKSSNYQNDWGGEAHGSSVGNSGKVPTGTYYYIINLKNSGLAPITGPIYVATN
ncbi:gliding motility-associated C-terminal domain-containing protein, partial [Winogradskyella echinorum]